MRAIEVDYEELPVLGTLEQALAPDAPRLHERRPKIGLFHGLGDLGEQQGNVCYRHVLEAGDLDAARAQAAITVEGTYTFPAVYQYAMETHATIAHYHGDGVTLWANCQHPFLVQAEIADLFGLPIGSVRIVVGYLGGGFGSKSYTKMEPMTVALARKAGRPVRIVNRVEESMVTSRRHGMRAWMRTTAAADGTLLTREVRFWMDTGAYADNGPRVTATAADAAPGPYRFAAVTVQANCVYCNTPPSGSYRAFGATTCSGSASPSSTRSRGAQASIRSSCDAARSCCRASRCARTAAASRSTPTSSATSSAPPRRSAGASSDGPGSAAASASACWPPAPTRSRAPRCACAPTARPTSTSAPPRWVRARAR